MATRTIYICDRCNGESTTMPTKVYLGIDGVRPDHLKDLCEKCHREIRTGYLELVKRQNNNKAQP